MDAFEALALSSRAWDQRLRLLMPSQYDMPSICPGWSVFDLVNHVVGGAVRYVMLLRGSHPAEVEATRETDHVGGELLLTSRIQASRLESEFQRPGALGRTVEHRSGTRSGLQLLHMRVLEQTLHGWDLARTLCTDERLDPDIVGYLLDTATPMLDSGRATGTYGSVPTAAGPQATPQEQLLLLAGRAP